MTDYYKHIDKVQDRMKDDDIFYEYNAERNEYYITNRKGIVIYTIPANKLNMDLAIAVNGDRHPMNLRRFWDQADTIDYHLVTPDNMEKIKDTERKRTLWKLKAENNYFPIHAYINNRLVVGFNIAGKKTKYHVYIAGFNKPIMIYAYEDGDTDLFKNRIAVIFPVIKYDRNRN